MSVCLQQSSEQQIMRQLRLHHRWLHRSTARRTSGTLGIRHLAKLHYFEPGAPNKVLRVFRWLGKKTKKWSTQHGVNNLLSEFLCFPLRTLCTFLTLLAGHASGPPHNACSVIRGGGSGARFMEICRPVIEIEI